MPPTSGRGYADLLLAAYCCRPVGNRRDELRKALYGAELAAAREAREAKTMLEAAAAREDRAMLEVGVAPAALEC